MRIRRFMHLILDFRASCPLRSPSTPTASSAPSTAPPASSPTARGCCPTSHPTSAASACAPTASTGGVARAGQSGFVRVPPGGTLHVSDIVFDAPRPIPARLTLRAPRVLLDLGRRIDAARGDRRLARRRARRRDPRLDRDRLPHQQSRGRFGQRRRPRHRRSPAALFWWLLLTKARSAWWSSRSWPQRTPTATASPTTSRSRTISIR